MSLTPEEEDDIARLRKLWPSIYRNMSSAQIVDSLKSLGLADAPIPSRRQILSPQRRVQTCLQFPRALVSPGETAVVSAHSMVTFRPEFFYVEHYGNYDVQFVVANDRVFLSPMFVEFIASDDLIRQVQIRLEMPVAHVGDMIRVEITNHGDTAARFLGCLKGTAAL